MRGPQLRVRRSPGRTGGSCLPGFLGQGCTRPIRVTCPSGARPPGHPPRPRLPHTPRPRGKQPRVRPESLAAGALCPQDGAPEAEAPPPRLGLGEGGGGGGRRPGGRGRWAGPCAGRGHVPPPDTPFALRDPTVGGGGQKGLWGAPGGTTGARSPSERCGRPWLGGRRTRQAPGAALWARASRPSFTAEEADPESLSCAPATPGLSTSPGPPCAAAGVSSGLSARVSPGSRWPRCGTRAPGEGRASTRRSGVPKAVPRTVPSLLEAAPQVPLPRYPGPAGEGLWTSASSPPAVSGLRPRRLLPGAPTRIPFGALWRSPSSGEGGLRRSSASGLPASGGPPPPEPRGSRMPSPGLEENVLQRSAFRGELTRCREAQSALLGTDPHAFDRIYSAPTTCRARPGTQRAPRPLAHWPVRVGNERLTGGLGSVCRTDRLAGGGGSGGWAPAEGGSGSGPRSRLLGRRREGRRAQEWSLD